MFVQDNSNHTTNNYNDARSGGGALSRKKGSAAPITGVSQSPSPIKNIDVSKASKLKKKQAPLTIREIESPVRARKRDNQQLSPLSVRSLGSDLGGLRSPQGSQIENQLRLDLIDEEENID